MHPYYSAGALTSDTVAWLSSIKEKDLNDCGKFTLVGDTGKLSKVDLSGMSTLEGIAARTWYNMIRTLF